MERRVRKPVTEREADRFVDCVVIAVADINAFAVLHGNLRAGEIVGAGVVLQSQRISFGKLAAGVYVPEQDIANRTAGGLACQIRVENCRNIVCPRQFHSRAAGKDDHDIFVDFQNFLNQTVVKRRQTQVFAVVAFGFIVVGKPDEEQDNFGAGGFLHRFRHKRVVGSFVFLFGGIALRIVELYAHFFQRVIGAVEFNRVD